MNANAINRGTVRFLTISFVPCYPVFPGYCRVPRYCRYDIWPIFGHFGRYLADIWSFWPIYLQKMPTLVPRLQKLIKILTVPRSQKLIN